jgi:septum formation protein
VSRRLVLASASPRRADLLRMLGLPFDLTPADVDEIQLPGEAPGEMAERLARAKATAARAEPPALVVAADTIVVIDGLVLGKPRDRAESAAFLRRLAGRQHEVITGLAVRALPEGDLRSERAVSRVRFAPLTEAEIAWYVATGEGMDKAGAYALQGIGALFVAAIDGSYTNVIGLPIERLYPHLKLWRLLP